MGTTTSKTPKKPFTTSNKRASKRILKRNSTIYPSNPSTVPCIENAENEENSENSEEKVVLRNEIDTSSFSKSAKKEKKKKRSENAVSGDENISTYHQTNVCYYKVENGKFLKLPNNTKHKSNDGCYIKLSNGSFRHFFNVSDETESQLVLKTKEVRQSMPVQKTSDKDKEKGDENKQQNRRIMVTMIDGGLPVVAVSKRDKVTNSVKKEKEKEKKVLLKIILLTIEYFECVLSVLSEYDVLCNFHASLILLNSFIKVMKLW